MSPKAHAASMNIVKLLGFSIWFSFALWVSFWMMILVEWFEQKLAGWKLPARFSLSIFVLAWAGFVFLVSRFQFGGRGTGVGQSHDQRQGMWHFCFFWCSARFIAPRLGINTLLTSFTSALTPGLGFLCILATGCMASM